MQPALTLVSNRLPVSVQKVDGRLEFYPSAGGLATGMSSYTSKKRTLWIGWPGIPNDKLTHDDRQVIVDELRKHDCYPVFLSQEQIDSYYNGYSNSLLWPLFHGTRAAQAVGSQQSQQWKAYQEVNEAFAQTVLKQSPPRNLIWIHDYQLLLVPGILRAKRPNNRIGFFLHIPFPPSVNFSQISNAEQLLGGVLGADLIGFHTEGYMHNFLESASLLQSGIVTQNEIVLGRRVIRSAVFPMSIDYSKYAHAAKLYAVKRELAKLRLKYRKQKLILTVDRLDPAKGLVERAQAFQTLLAKNPQLRQKVTMIMLVVPSRTEITEYQQLKTRLEAIVEDTNKQYGTKRWQPIDYMYQSVPFEQLSALYRCADVAFIAPLRDGMNLVAKEYLASQTQKGGVLVLSQTAGAAQELKEAIMVDPSQPNSLVQGLRRAIDISKPQWQQRIRKMQRQVSTSNIYTWTESFIKTLHTPIITATTLTHRMTNHEIDRLAATFHTTKRRLLLLDYDGTLTPIVSHPEDAQPSKQLIRLLTKLSKLPLTQVVVMSGRPKQELTQWLGGLPVDLIAEYGAFYRTAHTKEWHRTNGAKYAWKQELIPILQKHAIHTPGAFLEIKESALVWHYRLATPYRAQKNLVTLRHALNPLLEKHGLRASNGKKTLEIYTTGIGKGNAIKRWMANNPDFVLAAGDDYTDEDIFLNTPEHAFTIKVGRGRTTARWRLANVNALLKVLAALSK